jgi:hypothetical protein
MSCASPSLNTRTQRRRRFDLVPRTPDECDCPLLLGESVGELRRRRYSCFQVGSTLGRQRSVRKRRQLGDLGTAALVFSMASHRHHIANRNSEQKAFTAWMTRSGRAYSRLQRDLHWCSLTGTAGMRPRMSVSPWTRGHLCRKGHEMNALIDDTQRQRTDWRPGDGARGPNVLVVALDTLVPTQLTGTKVLVVAPALNSWLRRWLSDEDGARRRAEERAVAVADRLEQSGIHAEGRAGDGDPLLAIADALSTFPADEIVIAAQPGRSSENAEELGSRARVRFALPTSRYGESPPNAAWHSRE